MENALERSIIIRLTGAVVIVFGIPALAGGDTVTISLPEFSGTYNPGSSSERTAYFDFGTTFPAVEAAYINLVGTAEKGTAYEYFSPDVYHDLYGYFDFVLNPVPNYRDGSYWWTEIDPPVGSFDSEEAFTWCTWPVPDSRHAEPCWDFLLDGEGEVAIEFECPFALSWVPVTLPVCTISEAYLVVEPVPEPGMVVLLGVGWFFAVRPWGKPRRPGAVG